MPDFCPFLCEIISKIIKIKNMTCIVGYIEKSKEGDVVYIAGDSAAVGGLNISVRKDPKVFAVGEFIFGYTSSFRMGQLLMYSFEPPEIKEGVDLHKYMCTDFTNELRKTFKNGGYLSTNNGEETAGTFIVGVRGRLFVVQNDLQVGECYDQFVSVGCGKSFALGAMYYATNYATNRPLYSSTVELLTESLNAACYFNGGVRAPYTILSLCNKQIKKYD